MIPEYLENLMKEYALLETEFQGAYEAQLASEFGGDPFDPKPFYEKILAQTIETCKDFGPEREQSFAALLQKSIKNLPRRIGTAQMTHERVA